MNLTWHAARIVQNYIKILGFSAAILLTTSCGQVVQEGGSIPGLEDHTDFHASGVLEPTTFLPRPRWPINQAEEWKPEIDPAEPTPPAPEFNRENALMRRVRPDELPDISPKGNLNEFIKALERQVSLCENGGKIYHPDRVWTLEDRQISVRDWCIETGRAFISLAKGVGTMDVLWREARHRFHWYRSGGSHQDARITYTGYYIPRLRGSKTKTSRYQHPIYRVPPTLSPNACIRHGKNGSCAKRWWRRVIDGKVSYFPTRKEIYEEQVPELEDPNLVIAYVDDYFELHSMHIQGSGIIDLEEGGEIFVNYAGQNGRSWCPPGTGKTKACPEGNPLPKGVKNGSLQDLRKGYEKYPREMLASLLRDKSYIFFTPSNVGPIGGSGAILAGEHSVAIDPRYYPFGAIGLAETTRPKGTEDISRDPFINFIIAQDGGGAIKGASRVDYYWGIGQEGAYPEIAAGGHRDENGRLYFAVAP